MAGVASQLKKVTRPLRLMGPMVTDTEGPILYFEYGSFTVADNATTGTITTGLTNIIIFLTSATNAYGVTGAAWSATSGRITDGLVTITTTDPNGTAGYNYFIIGTVETA